MRLFVGWDVTLMETRQVNGALNPCRSTRIGRMPRALRACFTLAGSDPFTANPSRRKRFVPCLGRERPYSRDDHPKNVHAWSVAELRV